MLALPLGPAVLTRLLALPLAPVAACPCRRPVVRPHFRPFFFCSWQDPTNRPRWIANDSQIHPPPSMAVPAPDLLLVEDTASRNLLRGEVEAIIPLPRPEVQAPPEIFYNKSEARKYMRIFVCVWWCLIIFFFQATISERALELPALPNDGVPRPGRPHRHAAVSSDHWPRSDLCSARTPTDTTSILSSAPTRFKGSDSGKPLIEDGASGTEEDEEAEAAVRVLYRAKFMLKVKSSSFRSFKDFRPDH